MYGITKMDSIWVATAFLIHPDSSQNHLVTFSQIINKIKDLFGLDITPVMIHKHLVSWEDRMRSVKNPNIGGSRNRYLFKTVDGIHPTSNGNFRLYKISDTQYDGSGKTGKTHPEITDIPDAYHYLIEWYQELYFNS